ncbi:MAG: pyridoxal-phosphate dependent enzyme [Aureibaculum sp.]
MELTLQNLNQPVKLSFNNEVEITIKREDKIHPYISGNKYRKIKYNLIAAKEQGYTTLLTFGGAFSNHIAATAATGCEFGFKTIGIIRGDELDQKINENPTLAYALKSGMYLKFISRTLYREKNETLFLEKLKQEFGSFYLLPEGGTNELAIKGCKEILTKDDEFFDYICVSVGTGGTIAGLINSALDHQKVLGFPALKGDFLNNEIKKYIKSIKDWKLINDYHFGGYGKINSDLITFINKFKKETEIPLDPVYTGKMMYGIIDMIKNDYFKSNSKILIIHTGGLQGIQGMNIELQRKGLPLIN